MLSFDRVLWKAYKLANKYLSRKAGYVLVSAIELALPWRSAKPLVEATGTWDIGHALLSSPLYRPTTGLTPTTLCSTMSRHGSDKALYRHNYTLLYGPLLETRQAMTTRLFELGIGSIDPALPANMGSAGTPGASLRGWRDYLPQAQIFAADIDPAALLSEDRIQCYLCDQTDPAAIARMWSNAPLAAPFDVIIDDGMHEFHANRCFMENALHKLAPGGLFIVEDVKHSDLPEWAPFLQQQFAEDGAFDWSIVKLRHPFNVFDNNVVIVRHRLAR